MKPTTTSLSGILFKLKMLTSIPYQEVVTANGEHFQLLKLGLFTCPDGDAHSENVELVRIRADTHYRKHCHNTSDAIIYIMQGTGRLLLGSRVIRYEPLLRVAIPQKVMHGFVTDEETVFLSIQSPHIVDPITGKVDIHYEAQ